jgi:multisubunit Na+/H+ antiporter MnhB subunit
MHALTPLSWLVLAQQAAAAPTPVLASGLGLSALLIAAMLFILIIVAMGIRHARFERQLQHTERIRALEAGRVLPGEQPWWSPERLAVAIGAGVPLAALILGLKVTSSGTASGEMWFAVGLIGVAGVVCGTQLALRLPQSPIAHAKPYVSPDEFSSPN